MVMPEPQPKRQSQKQQRTQEVEARLEPEWQQVGEASASSDDVDVAFEPEPSAGGGVGGDGGLGARPGGGTTRGEGRSMSAVMDELLGNDIGVPLSSVGPACAQVMEAMPKEAGQSLLATVFWWLFTKSPAYSDTVDQLGAAIDARPVVVGHAEGTRFDLLLLDPQRGDDSGRTPARRAGHAGQDGLAGRVGRTHQRGAAPCRPRPRGSAGDASR